MSTRWLELQRDAVNTQHARQAECAPSPLVGEGWGGGSQDVNGGAPISGPPPPTPPHKGEGSRPGALHVCASKDNGASSKRKLGLALACALALAGCDGPKQPTYQGWVEAELIFVAPDEVGRIETLTVREGDSIEKGNLVFTVDPDLQQADVAMAEATVKNAQLAYDRAAALLKTSSGTQKSVEDAEAAMRTAQARLNSAQTRLKRRKVFSPVSGTIQQLYFRAGELVPAGKPVVAILPPGNLKIRFFVNEATLPKLKLGDPVTVLCDGCDPDITAKISFIARMSEFTPPVIYSLDERSKLVFLIEARTTDRPERLRVGQPVSIVLGEPP